MLQFYSLYARLCDTPRLSGLVESSSTLNQARRPQWTTAMNTIAVERKPENRASWPLLSDFLYVMNGGPDRQYGYLFGEKGAEPGHRPAIAIDDSEWDDPDYEFLAFIGRDRPFTDRECGHEPGEGVD